MRWKTKVASSLTDVWQQLFEQQDITVMCNFTSVSVLPKIIKIQCGLRKLLEKMKRVHFFAPQCIC